MPKYRRQKISKGEKRILEYLESKKILYIREFKYSECKSEKGWPLRFDFYLEEYNLLIEYQGHHHFKPINKYRRAKITHEKTVVNDNIKKEFIKKNNINLLEIHYKDYDNIESILENYLKTE